MLRSWIERRRALSFIHPRFVGLIGCILVDLCAVCAESALAISSVVRIQRRGPTRVFPCILADRHE